MGTTTPTLKNYVQKFNDFDGVGTNVVVGLGLLNLWDVNIETYIPLQVLNGILLLDGEYVAMEDSPLSTLRRGGVLLHDNIGDGDYFLSASNLGLDFNGYKVITTQGSQTINGALTATSFLAGEGLTSAPSVRLGSTATGFYISATGTSRIGVLHAGSVMTQLATTDIRISNGMMFSSSNSSTATAGSVDVSLSRLSPSTWQMGNGGVNSLGTLNLAAINASGQVTAGGGFFGAGIRNTGGASLSIAAGTYSTTNVNPVTVSPTMTQSAGTQGALAISPTYNQTGTAGSTDLLINRTETALGSGLHNFIDCQVGGVSRFSVSNAGNLTASGTIRLGTFTVGTLPSAAANTRARAFVTDSNLSFNSTNLGSTVTAGGSTLVPVFSNGTNWVIG